MWSEEGIEILLVIFNNKDKDKVQRQRERGDSRKALLLWFSCFGRWACVLVGFASTEAMFRKFAFSKRATGWARGPTLSPSAARIKSLTLLLVYHCFRLFLLFIVLNLTFLVQVLYSLVLNILLYIKRRKSSFPRMALTCSSKIGWLCSWGTYLKEGTASHIAQSGVSYPTSIS